MRSSFLLAVSMLGTLPLAAAGDRFEAISLHGQVLLGGGDPTNDQIGGALTGRIGLTDRWKLVISLEHSPEFDIERVARQLGLEQATDTEVVDSKASSTSLLVFVESEHPLDSERWRLFWGAGLGASSIDAESAAGQLAGGASFRVEIDAGTNVAVSAIGGFRYTLSQHLELETALRLDWQFADWTIREQVSGRVATQGDYLLYGVQFGIGWRF